MDGIGETFDQRTHVSFSQAVSLSPPPQPHVPSTLLSLPSGSFCWVGAGRGSVGGPVRSLIGSCMHLTGVCQDPGLEVPQRTGQMCDLSLVSQATSATLFTSHLLGHPSSKGGIMKRGDGFPTMQTPLPVLDLSFLSVSSLPPADLFHLPHLWPNSQRYGPWLGAMPPGFNPW